MLDKNYKKQQRFTELNCLLDCHLSHFWLLFKHRPPVIRLFMKEIPWIPTGTHLPFHRQLLYSSVSGPALIHRSVAVKGHLGATLMSILQQLSLHFKLFPVTQEKRSLSITIRLRHILWESDWCNTNPSELNREESWGYTGGRQPGVSKFCGIFQMNF